MKISILIRNAFFSAVIFSVADLSAQDIHFSQFNQAPLTLNPALAGTTVWIRAVLQYRSQWKALHSENSPNTYSTMGAGFDIKSKKRWIKIKNATEKYRLSGENGFGWGVNVFNDRAGDGKMGTLQANVSLAYQIYMSEKNMLAFGFQGGIMQRSINYDKLYWGNQYDPASSLGYNSAIDPRENRSNNSFVVPDIGAGLIYNYKKSERYIRGGDQMEVTLGGGIFHANQPKYSFLDLGEKLSMRMTFHGNAIIGISNTNVALAPGFMIAKQGPNQEIFLGTMVRYMLRENSKYTGFVKGANVSAGGYYRNKDAFIAIAMFEFSSYGVGLSYDLNVSGLKTVSSGRGGLEITLRFLNPSPFIYSQASFNQ